MFKKTERNTSGTGYSPHNSLVYTGKTCPHCHHLLELSEVHFKKSDHVCYLPPLSVTTIKPLFIQNVEGWIKGKKRRYT